MTSRIRLGQRDKPMHTPLMTDLSGHTLMYRIARWIARIDWRSGLQQFLMLGNAAFLLALVYTVFTPHAAPGILGYSIEDLVALRGVTAPRAVNGVRALVISVVAAFFLRDIGMNLRGVRPRYGSLFSVTGFGLLALITTHYTVIGKVSLIGFAGHVGAFTMAFLSLWHIAQHEEARKIKAQYLAARERPPMLGDVVTERVLQRGGIFRPLLPAKNLLIPALSIFMFATALGLITQPDSVIVAFAQHSLGFVFSLLVLVWLIVGSGLIAFNSIAAKWLGVALMGQWLFSIMLVLLSLSQGGVSLIGVLSHVMLSGISFFIMNIQTEYAG
jgi:hypothetical protein